MTSPIAGRLSERFGARIISLIGLILVSVGCLSISTFSTNLSIFGFILRFIPLAIGTSLFYAPNQSAVMKAIPSQSSGIASALLSLSRKLGEAIGLPVMGILFSSLTIAHAKTQSYTTLIDVTDAPIEALVFGLQMIFRVLAPILLVSVILTAILWQLEQRNHTAFDFEN